MAELAEGNKNCCQLLLKKTFEPLWKVDPKTKVVHYFENSNRIFFSGPIVGVHKVCPQKKFTQPKMIKDFYLMELQRSSKVTTRQIDTD